MLAVVMKDIRERGKEKWICKERKRMRHVCHDNDGHQRAGEGETLSPVSKANGKFALSEKLSLCWSGAAEADRGHTGQPTL